MRLPKLCLCLAGTFLCAGLRADVTLAPLFSDHAVLQRGKPVPVWGRADPGEKVTVRFLGRAVQAVADAKGRWLAVLHPMDAESLGSDLVAAGKTQATAHDIVVGEVWIASGQSNMEFTVDDPRSALFHLKDAAAEVAAANYPGIREFAVAHAVAESPAEAVRGDWDRCSPLTMGAYTAVGYFFARDLYKRLGVPIGIINSSVGGTPVESWMSAEALKSDPAFAVVYERWARNLADYPEAKAKYDASLETWNAGAEAARAQGADAEAAYLKARHKPRPPRGPGDKSTPSGLFNAMIDPLAPFAIRGAIWYQGEANAPRASEYHRLFAAMITDWRRSFGEGDFPFFWVQLANYNVPTDETGQTYAFLREAQTQTLSLPATGQAVTIDIGNPNNIHPGNKQEVGRRLALIAKTEVYGIPDDYSGPVFRDAYREGPAMRLRFKFAYNGLTASEKPLQSFELAGADRKFHPAEAKIEGDMILVRSPEVPDPVAVRYAWSNAPEANLYNGAGLPAVPFRSDDW